MRRLQTFPEPLTSDNIESVPARSCLYDKAFVPNDTYVPFLPPGEALKRWTSPLVTMSVGHHSIPVLVLPRTPLPRKADLFKWPSDLTPSHALGVWHASRLSSCFPIEDVYLTYPAEQDISNATRPNQPVNGVKREALLAMDILHQI